MGNASMSAPSLVAVSMKDNWDERKQNIYQISDWKATGRLVASKGKEGANASFTWTQKGEYYNIKLFGPFGAGSAHLTGNAKQVVFDDADGKRTITKDPETLIQRKMGLSIPLKGLKYWIKGVPSPFAKIDFLEVNKSSELKRLKQNGWVIQYTRYDHNTWQSLPKKIMLTNRDLKVKLVIQQWKA